MTKACSECEHDTAERGELSAVCKACLYARPEWKPKKEEPVVREVSWQGLTTVRIFEKARKIVVTAHEDLGKFDGVAKCDLSDTWDLDKGTTLAYARALRNWANAVEREAKK